MKLKEIIKLQLPENKYKRLRFPGTKEKEKIKELYNKYKNKDCVVAHISYKDIIENKKRMFNRNYIIIKGDDKYYGLCLCFYLHTYDLLELHKWVKTDAKKELTILNETEYGNVKKQMLVEALEKWN